MLLSTVSNKHIDYPIFNALSQIIDFIYRLVYFINEKQYLGGVKSENRDK